MSRVIVPRWLYEKAVKDLGREVADRIMANHNAIVAEHWSEVPENSPDALPDLGGDQ